MKQKGEITVFLSLVLVILVPILFTIIEEARTNGMRFQVECVMDMALQSVLAEYNRELLAQYDLFYVDRAYGTTVENDSLLENHIRKYLDVNFQSGSVPVKDFLGLYTDTVEITRAAAASDEKGEVLKKQAVSYMVNQYGLEKLLYRERALSASADTADEKKLLSNQMEEKRNKNQKEIADVDTTIEKEDGSKETVEVDNPADSINRLRKSGELVDMVTKDADGVSDKRAALGEYLSQRGNEERDGFFCGLPSSMKGEEVWFQLYLMEKCGSYTTPKENGGLDYEIEFLLAGKSSDRENLKWVVNRLLALRETSNFLYIMQDGEKKAEAEALALTLSAVLLFPELKDLITLSILIAWSFAESLQDVKILLEGGKVPLFKTKESWRLSLQNALSVEENIGGRKEDTSGLNYQEYLHIFLLLSSQEQKQLRFMDVVEMDIRKTRGNESFRLDNCLEQMEVTAGIKSRMGQVFQITRRYGYEK